MTQNNTTGFKQVNRMQRVVVIGSSCSGKSTFARQLSKRLDIKHVELDQLHWKPNWEERPDDDFRTLVESEVSGEKWIVDGNYSVVRNLVWPKATTIVWLNYPFTLVLYRTIKRSIIRAVTKEPLFAGNVETIRQSFFSKHSIIWWVIKTYHKKRAAYPGHLERYFESGVGIIELKRPGETSRFIEELVLKVK